MHDDILATDLANHLRILKQLEKLAEEGFSSSSHHKSLLSSLLMTACDLSACTKDWETSVSVSVSTSMCLVCMCVYVCMYVCM